MRSPAAPHEPVSLRTWPWLLLAGLLLGVASMNSFVRMVQDTYRFLFVLDITQSMNVLDMKLEGAATTRLEFAKEGVAFALRNLPCGSEAGLAIFTEYRSLVLFTPVEVCRHYRALNDMLDKIGWRMAWAARSEIAKGLDSAMDAARQSQHDTRLVFLTDGHEAPPVNRDLRPPFRTEAGTVAGLIAGIGGSEASRIPHIDDADNVIGYWTRDEVMQIDVYSQGRAATGPGEAMVGVNMANVARRIALGQEHLSSLREQYLQELANETGLDYIRVESPSQLVQSLRRDTYARRTPVSTDAGWMPATLAFIFLVYSFLLLPARAHRAAARQNA